MLPTLEQALAKLQANPAAAKEFDNCRPDLSRRQHCQLVLSQVENSCSTIANSKKLADQRAINAKLKQDIALAKARIGVAQAAIAAKKTAPSAAAKPAKSCLGNTNLSKVSNFFAAQAR
jgi:hypothetical protein